MQTVINNYIVNSTIVGSAIAQGGSNCTVTISNGGSDWLIEEVVSLFMSFSRKKQVEALAYLYDFEAGNVLSTEK